MSKQNAAGKPIPTCNQEWPNQNESWAEFITRTDAEGIESSKVATLLGFAILAASIIFVLIDALDKGM